MSVTPPDVQPTDFDQFSILVETAERDFFRPNLERYQPPDFPQLTGANLLLNRLKQNRLLFISGEAGLDPLSFARYTAWHLSEECSQKSGATLEVLEWNGLGGQSVDRAIERFTKPTIFILPNLKPQHVTYQMSRLQSGLGDRHYGVVSLENTILWDRLLGDGGLRSLKVDLRSDRVFTRQDVGRFLCDRLLTEFPEAIQRHSGTDQVFIVDTAVEYVADRLKNFVNIDQFVRLLKERATGGPRDHAVVETCLRLATDDTALLREWYSKLEKPRSQLLALAVSLLDGLGESQFFAAVDLLVNQAWRLRDPGLCALDYCDLDDVRNFYEESPPSLDGDRVFKGRLVDQRWHLLGIIWGQHRRNVLSTLPVLFQCVDDSLDAQAENLVLYGGPAQRAQLRKTLGEALGDISALDTVTTEAYLVRLAIHPNVGAQAVAANALARWRMCGRLSRLVSLLHRWMDDEELRRTVERLRPESVNTDLPTALSSVKQTVAMTVGYAAQNDQMNLLHRDLFEILKLLAVEKDVSVLKALASYTIPMLLTRHFEQVEGVVMQLAQHEVLHDALAQSVAQTYRKQSADVMRVLDDWLRANLRGARRARGKGFLTAHALPLVCICTIFGKLPYEAVPQGFTISQMINRMRRVLYEERHPKVRQTALTAVIAHSRTHFTEFQDLVAQLDADEQAKIVAKLVEVYDEQRRTQTGGEETVRVRNVIYPIWIINPRPLTNIEIEMIDWVKNSQNAVAQQIAVQAQISFLRSLEREIEKKIRQIESARRRRRRKRPTRKIRLRLPLLNGLYPRLFYEYHIIPWLVTMFAPRYRPIIRGVLPELIEQNLSETRLVALLLLKWQAITDQDIAEVGKRAKQALFWASFKGKLCFFLAILIVCIAGTTILHWMLQLALFILGGLGYV